MWYDAIRGFMRASEATPGRWGGQVEGGVKGIERGASQLPGSMRSRENLK